MTCKAKTAILATLRQELPLATKKTSTGRLLGIRGVFGDWNQHPLGLVPCCTLAQDLQGWSLPRKLSAMLWRLMAVLRQWISISVAILTGLRSNTDNVLVLCSCIHGEVLVEDSEAWTRCYVGALGGRVRRTLQGSVSWSGEVQADFYF